MVQADVLVELLKRAGHRASAAHTAGAARDAYARNRPDIVIADLLIAGMSGEELIAALRAMPGPRPAVVLTSTRESPGAGSGVHDVLLRKPFTVRELYAAVAAALAAWRGPLAN